MGRPRLAVIAASVMLVLTFTVRVETGGLTDVTLLLFALPITLLSAAFGVRGGLIAGLASVALVAVSATAGHQSLGPVGWSARLVPLLAIGLVLGDAMDRLRAAESERVRLAQAARRHHEAVQLNDTIVQSLAAAKWALEGGDLAGGLEIVAETLHQSNQLVSDLIRGADLHPLWMGSTPGRPDPDPARITSS